MRVLVSGIFNFFDNSGILKYTIYFLHAFIFFLAKCQCNTVEFQTITVKKIVHKVQFTFGGKQWT